MCHCMILCLFFFCCIQSSVSDNDKSKLEQYLNDELETMRQAFQIRLGQLEKRYQRQLVFEQQRHLTKSPASDIVVRKSRRNPFSSKRSNSSHRRNSWHSYIASEQELDKLAQPDEPRSESSLGIDSDYSIEGSDAEVEGWGEEEGEGEGEEARKTATGKKKSVQITEPSSPSKSSPNDLPKSPRDGQSRGIMPIYSSPKKPKEGLKGGAKAWREESEGKRAESPQLSPVSNEISRDEVGSVDDDAKSLIQQKIEEYRKKMSQYFQEKSEAQISVIEEKYQKQMDEVKRKYDSEASVKLSHLTTRIKDLENQLEVQTLV